MIKDESSQPNAPIKESLNGKISSGLLKIVSVRTGTKNQPKITTVNPTDIFIFRPNFINFRAFSFSELKYLPTKRIKPVSIPILKMLARRATVAVATENIPKFEGPRFLATRI